MADREIAERYLDEMQSANSWWRLLSAYIRFLFFMWYIKLKGA